MGGPGGRGEGNPFQRVSLSPSPWPPEASRLAGGVFEFVAYDIGVVGVGFEFEFL